MSKYSANELLVFKYLFALQESGVTNMLGASSYIKRHFSDLKLDDCIKLLYTWMDNYEDIERELHASPPECS